MNQKNTTPPDAAFDQRCPSGIEGFDDILAGGLSADCFYVIQGDSGSGKTTLALQFLLEGVRRGEKVFYITLSETKQEMLRVAHSHGWSLDQIPLLELSAIDALVKPESQTTVFHPSEMELVQVSKLLLAEVGKHQPSRVVFDSLLEFRLLAETPLRYRRQLLNLKQEFARYKSTVLLLDDKMDGNRVGSDPHVLGITDGVVEMEQFSPDYGVTRRRLRVLKMRGIKFREGYHDYIITTGGLRIFPRVVAPEHQAPFQDGMVSSGIKELDDLFGGGLDRGTTTLFLGQAGTGKSTLALQYAVQMADHGERSMFFCFDETSGVLQARAEALGIGLAKHIPTGMVTVQQADPAEISPGEFVKRILTAVEKGCKLVVIDSLNGYLHSMPTENFLNNQLHELTFYLNQHGVMTILILSQQGLFAGVESPVYLSYLADTVVSIRFFEAAGYVKQALAVIKKRKGYHEKTIREFSLETGKGLRIGQPLTEFQGVLTGVPRFVGGAKKMMKSSNA